MKSETTQLKKKKLSYIQELYLKKHLTPAFSFIILKIVQIKVGSKQNKGIKDSVIPKFWHSDDGNMNFKVALRRKKLHSGTLH